MEDRITPGLYLEMTELTPDEYAARRVADVLALAEVERATWWINVKRDREDLPRVLPEFDTLGVYEVGERFVAPETPDGITGYHFRHYRRPGQGRLTGKPTVGLSLVLISPTKPDQAQALRDWADFVHLNYISAVGVPGYSMVTPYENVTGGDPLYMHFYEMDTEDAEHSFKLMTPLVETRFGGQISPEFQDWAGHPALRIIYVNSFRRVGEKRA
ncbi:MAG: hypothetical protein E6G60_17740 [Actinobacteria bacterium]|nr:MAG: hypothetical protein E6G60_17740 [Actinomycetota bacterium]